MQDQIEKLLKRVVCDLKDQNVSFALVGGLAYGSRAEPRFTRAIDFTIAVSNDSEAEEVTAGLIRSGYLPRVELANRHTGELATFRMQHTKAFDGVPADESPFIDLLFSHCGIEHEIVQDATDTEPIAGLPIPTATVPYLVAMKLLSESDRRLQDRIDLQNLIAVASPDDLATVPPLLTLITQRGFNNGKDLQSVFDAFLREHRDAQA
jgi:hypothetical protein